MLTTQMYQCFHRAYDHVWKNDGIILAKNSVLFYLPEEDPYETYLATPFVLIQTEMIYAMSIVTVISYSH